MEKSEADELMSRAKDRLKIEELEMELEKTNKFLKKVELQQMPAWKKTGIYISKGLGLLIGTLFVLSLIDGGNFLLWLLQLFVHE